MKMFVDILWIFFCHHIWQQQQKNKNTSRFLQNKHFSNIFLLSNNVLILLRRPIIYLDNCTFKHLKWSFVWLNNPFGCYFYLSKVLTKCFVGIPLVSFLDHVIVLTICCLITNYPQISYLKQCLLFHKGFEYQKPKSGLPGWFWPKLSHDVAVKLLVG